MLEVRLSASEGLIGLLEIRNDGSLSDGSGDSELGAYDYVLWRRRTGSTGDITKGRVERFVRKRGAWALVNEVLADTQNAADD